MVQFKDEKLENAKPFANFNDMKNFVIYGVVSLIILAIIINL